MIQLKFKDKELETEYLENLQIDLKHTGLDIEISQITTNEENDEILDVLEDETFIKFAKEFFEEICDNLEKVVILLEDNPKIKDKEEFYNSEDLMLESKELLIELNTHPTRKGK